MAKAPAPTSHGDSRKYHTITDPGSSTGDIPGSHQITAGLQPAELPAEPPAKAPMAPTSHGSHSRKYHTLTATGERFFQHWQVSVLFQWSFRKFQTHDTALDSWMFNFSF